MESGVVSRQLDIVLAASWVCLVGNMATKEFNPDLKLHQRTNRKHDQKLNTWAKRQKNGEREPCGAQHKCTAHTQPI
jgi:hypothetical protein